MTSPTPITVEWTLKRLRGGQAKPVALDAACQERIPRLARLMALAIKFDTLVRQGVVPDYADLACLGHVSRARITQIMNLLNLAPDIQEQLIDLRTPNGSGRTLCERNLRQLVRMIAWSEQRQFWQKAFSSKEA